MFPPTEDMALVESKRRRFDPLARLIPAHITLVFPFESEISAQALRKHIQAVAAGIGAYRVALGDVSGTDDHYLFLNVRHGAAAVVDLHDRLYTGPLRRFLANDRPFVPHLTVGRLETGAETRQALETIAATDVHVETTVKAVSVYRIAPGQGRAIEFEVALG